ncbi:Protein suppressor of hairy wing [Orchesella cincta]|uniref:Protein suppressor of hairy wing n=1 Tax=Orchesella cincta TaxID=48709 RepID=A0A1D2MKE4_ORCCI|nr:Protein suppressor of hairy wing [Orchesella cincta]
MGVEVCLVCLKTFESGQDELLESSGIPLFTKFLKFVQNYLQISPLTRMNKDREVNDVFCEKWELSVINPICQVYLELLSAQLRLSWEMEQLGKQLKSSQGSSSSSDKLRVDNISTLKERLGIENVKQLEEFRSLVAQKCQLKRKEVLPDLIVSRCSDVEMDIKREPIDEDVDDDDDSYHLDFDTERDSTTGLLDLEGFTENPESENEIEIKIEPVVHVPISEKTVAQLPQNSTFKLSNPNQKGKPSRFVCSDGRKMVKVKCEKCDKVLLRSSFLPRHNRYHHDPINCSACEQSFQGKKHLDRHFYRHHHEVGSYHCKNCPKVFTTYDKLSVHRNKYHNQPGSHPCPHCPGKVYRTLKYLRKHTRTEHRISSELTRSIAISHAENGDVLA